jgi:hypothetical protein
MFMLLGSPLLWVHHAVLVALPYLLMLKRVDTPTECVIYGFAFFLEYDVPTFDFFPWSFVRLLSPLILIYLMYATAARVEDGSLWRWLTVRRSALRDQPVMSAANRAIDGDGE